MLRLVATFMLVLACTTTLQAAELRSIEVGHDAGEYHLVSVVWFGTGIESTYRVFSRWKYSTRFSNAIVEARDLPPDVDGQPGFYVKNRGCVVFFCKTLVRQGRVELYPNVSLRAYADPAHSDFELSDERWTFAEEDGGTRVRYELHLRPNFWVPPAIGPYLIQRKLRKNGVRALDRIESIAREVAEAEGLD
jgi:hypothetical protein